METLTLEKAQALVQEIIAENGGSEAKYSRADQNCYYVHNYVDDVFVDDFTPDVNRREWGCLVGQVFGKFGVPIDDFNDLMEMSMGETLANTLRGVGLVDIEPSATRYLQIAQIHQDAGATWENAHNRAVDVVNNEYGTQG